MKAKVYLKMLACLVGLLTFYSCNNDLEQDKNASVEAQQVQNGQEVSLQENAYADYLELMKSLNSSPTRSMSTAEIPAYYGGCYINDDGNLVVLVKKGEGVSVLKTRAALSRSTIYESCQYSYKELQQVVEDIRQKALEGNNFLYQNVTIYGISEKENIVEVGLLHKNSSTIQEFKKKICDSNKIKFVNCGKIILNDGIDCAGEIKTIRDGKTHNASIGYRAKDKNGNIGIVTAGHFIKVNDILKDSANVEIGKCLYSKEEYYVDAAFCSITSKKHAPTNKIKFMKDLQKDTLSIALAQPPKGSWINMVGMVSKRSSGTIFNASYDVPNSAQKTIYKDVILAKYTSNSGDSGGIVYALTKATNTRYTVGINLGSITYNGVTYGACIKAYFVFILLILGTTSVSSKEEYNIKNESKTYLNDSLKISAIVHDKKPSFVTITIENYGKKQISIGKVYGLLTYINNRWTYLTKAKNKFIKINPKSAKTIRYSLCIEKIRNSEISFTYSENRKNRIRLDVYSNNEFMGKIDCDFATPFNAVWSKHDGVIIVKYD